MKRNLTRFDLIPGSLNLERREVLKRYIACSGDPKHKRKIYKEMQTSNIIALCRAGETLSFVTMVINSKILLPSDFVSLKFTRDVRRFGPRRVEFARRSFRAFTPRAIMRQRERKSRLLLSVHRLFFHFLFFFLFPRTRIRADAIGRTVMRAHLSFRTLRYDPGRGENAHLTRNRTHAMSSTPRTGGRTDATAPAHAPLP